MHEKQISILIVDDEEDFLEISQEFFEAEGFHVLTAYSANEAMNIYKNNLDIRLILCDLKLVGTSGIEFLKALSSTYQNIPVFYLVTGDDERSEEYVKSLGAYGILYKPFDIDITIARIKIDLKI